MKKYLITSILAVAVASCTAPHPKMLSFTPASVVVDYTGNDLHEATNMAQQYCSSIGKDAQYVDAKEEGTWGLSTKSTAFFNCVESFSRGGGHNGHGGPNNNNSGGAGAGGSNIFVIPNGGGTVHKQ